MTKPKCPYCGAEMKEIETLGHTFYWKCARCLAQSPHDPTRSDAAEAAMKRTEMSAVDYIKARIRAEAAIRAECSRRAQTATTHMFKDRSVKNECGTNGCSNCSAYYLQFSRNAEGSDPEEMVARVQRWAQEHAGK